MLAPADDSVLEAVACRLALWSMTCSSALPVVVVHFPICPMIEVNWLTQATMIASMGSYSAAQWMGELGGRVTASAAPEPNGCVRRYSASTGVRDRGMLAPGG